jgi:hypothetical protein
MNWFSIRRMTGFICATMQSLAAGLQMALCVPPSGCHPSEVFLTSRTFGANWLKTPIRIRTSGSRIS